MATLSIAPRSVSPTRRAADVVLVAVALALIVGTLHALVSWVRRVVIHDLLRTYMSPDMWWMSPLGYLLIFLPIAAVIALLALVVPRFPAMRTSAFVFGMLGAFAVLLLFPRLHQYASLALALGIGVRIAASLGGDPPRWRRRLARVSVALGALTVVSWGFQTASVTLRERRMLAGPPATPAGAPNVLFLILDTVRASNLSLYDAPRATTPRLRQLALESTVFDWAFSTAPWTLPSHASMFTGRYSSQQTSDWTSPLDARYPTVAEAFLGAGYATAGFTANLVATTRGFGLDRGFSRYEDHRRSIGQMALSTALGQAESPRLAFEMLVHKHWIGGALKALAMLSFVPRYSYPDNDPKTATMVVGSFLRWQGAHADRPFFAFLNFFDAHGPYESPARYATMFATGDRARDKYDRAIRYLDDELGVLFDSLRARGVLDNTVVVLTADHGEQFGEHGLSWHSNSLYEQLVHVPLLVRYPGHVPAGIRVKQQVSLRDIGATMIDLSRAPVRERLGGVSLAPTWRSDGARTSEALAELSRGVNTDPGSHNAIGDMRAMADDSLHFIRNGDGSFEIYSYRRDPRETENLAKGPHAALVPGLESRVRTALGAAAGSGAPLAPPPARP